MKKVALQGIIFGSLFLSLELCVIKLLQCLDRVSGSWYEDIRVYIGQFPCNIGLFITAAVIVFSAVLFLKSGNHKKAEEGEG